MEIDINQSPSSDFPLLKRTDGRLEFDGVDVDNLLHKIGTPSFIFSEKVLENQYFSIINCFKKHNIHPFNLAFSIKSNPDIKVVKVLSTISSMFEATSTGEIERILSVGGKACNIIYTNAVKTKESINFALRYGVHYFAVDSLSDLRRIEKETDKENLSVKVLIRVNPLTEFKNVIFSCSGKTSKIGIIIPPNLDEESEMKQILLRCENSARLSYEGIHVHLGSQIEDITEYQRGMEKIGECISLLEKNGIKTSILDIGGGFPIRYSQIPQESINSFAKVIKSTIKKNYPDLRIIAESGRFLTAPAAILATTVINIKKDPEKNLIACLDGSFYNTLPDIIIAKWPFPIVKTILDGRKEKKYRIAGSSNDSLDIYAPNKSNQVYLQNFEEIKEGEKIIFLQAGAYSISFNSTYCLENRPKVYFIEKNKT